MPRVSEDHIAQRRQQVLDAALRCFARDGFHGTSMRDVVAESGLSAGAVYTYFPSKAALVSGAVEPILQVLHSAATDVLGPEPAPPAQALPVLLQRMVEVATTGPVDLARVAVTAWGEGLRDPEVHHLTDRVYGDLRATLAAAVRRWQDAGHLPRGADPTATAQVLLSTLTGFVLQHALLGDVDPRTYGRALEGLLTGAGE